MVSSCLSPLTARWHYMIVDFHMQCGLEGVPVSRHSRSRIPSSPLPGDRRTRFKESII